MKESLSLKDRLILANQYEILSRLADDEREMRGFENLRDLFTSGYSLYYSMATEWFSDEMSNVECKFVLDVLDMYRDLYFSREKSEELKNSIEEHDVLFSGFDLNDNQESRYYSFCQFLIEGLGRYTAIKKLIELGKIESLNSHGSGPSMETLERMVRKAKDVNKKRNARHDTYLNKEEIEEILNA